MARAKKEHKNPTMTRGKIAGNHQGQGCFIVLVYIWTLHHYIFGENGCLVLIFELCSQIASFSNNVAKYPYFET